LIILSQYFLGNYSFGVSWNDIPETKQYSAQIGLGSEFFFRNHLSFFFTNLARNTSYTITIRAYSSTLTVLDTGTLTRTTLNSATADNLDPYIKFTTKLTNQEVIGDEFIPEDTIPDVRFNCIYANCNATVIYYNSNHLEDIDESDIYDPDTKKTGLSSEFLPLIEGGDPKTRIMTQEDFETETGTTFVLPPGAANPFPITQTFYFALGFFYMDPSDSTDAADLYCIPESTGVPTLASNLTTETHLITTSKCKVIIPNTTCSDHIIKNKDGLRYKFKREV